MQFLHNSTGDTPEGKATMWQAAKTWQDSTVLVKSFGLVHLHDLNTMDDANEMSQKLNIPLHITAARSITLGDHPSSVQSKNGKHLHLLTNLLMETARWCTYWCTKTISASQNSLHPMQHARIHHSSPH